MISLLIIFHCTYIQTKFVQGALKYIQGLKFKKDILKGSYGVIAMLKVPKIISTVNR